MKKHKLRFNKVFIYLILLVAVVIGAFYVINIVNTQKLNLNSEATSKECRDMGVKGILASGKKYPGGCQDLAAKFNTPFYEAWGRGNYDPVINPSAVVCCIPRSPGFMDESTQKQKKKECEGKPNIIATKTGKRCTYFTGKWTNKKNQITCDVAPSDDFYACQDGPGHLLKTDKVAQISAKCKDLRNQMVPGSNKLYVNNNETCQIYTGAYRVISGNNGINPGATDFSSFCLRVDAVDLAGTIEANKKCK